jgi:hypothetical protein
VVLGSPALWTTAPSGASVGDYAINGSVGNLSAANYAFSITSGSFTVNKAVLTLSASSSVITYGQASPVFSYAVSGFVSGETVAVINGTASVNSSYSQTSPAGIYSIVVGVGTLSAANYTFQTVNGNLTVKKAQLLVTPLDTTMVYGSQLPQLTYAITGLVNGDTSAVVAGNGSVTTTALPASNAGVYPIFVDISTLSAQNYSFVKSQGNLTVTKALLIVTPYAIAMTYGGVTPRLTYQISGFMNGDPGSVVSGAPWLAASIPDGGPVGGYLITGTPGTLTAGNYTFVIGTSTLTINKAVLSVAPTPVSMTYGSAAPSLTYQMTGFVHGEGATVISGTPSLTTNCSPLSNAGTCTIFAAQGTLSAANYSFQMTNAAVPVNKALLSVAAANASMIYGGSVPVKQYQVSGFMNGDTVAVIAGQPLLTSGASSSSAAGTYSIEVNVSSLSASNYAFVAVPGSLTIAKAPLTLTPANAAMTYGGTWPAFSYQISGFVNGDSPAVVSGQASLLSNATSRSGVGMYSWNATTGSLSAANYTFVGGTGSLSVNAAVLTVVASNATMTYGATPPALRFGFSGFVNGDSAAAIAGAPSQSTIATTTSPAGTYPITITVGSLSAVNYTFAFADATMTVNKALLKLVPSNVSVLYGAQVPALAYSLLGFVNGDTPANATSGIPQLTTTALEGSPVGQYAIVSSIGTLIAVNYSIQTANAVVVVNKASLQVTALDVVTVYGGAIPVLNYQVTGFVNGDSGAVVTGQPVLTAKASPTSNAGIYSILVDVTGLSALNYSFVGVSGKISVGKAPLAVTPANALMTYGGSWPKFSYQISGFVNGDTAAVLSGGASLLTNANNRSGVGTYSWNAATASLWAENYSFVCGSATLSITPASLTVFASNAVMTYGAATPVLRSSVSGFVNGDGVAALSGVPVLTTIATSLSPPGMYPITVGAGTLSAENYTLSFVAASMTVNKAVLKVVPANLAMTYGTAVPVLAYSLQGFVNDDTQANATAGTAQLTTAALPTSPVGQYDILSGPGTMGSTNYSFVFQNGKLTVAPSPLTVTADNQSMKIGATVPALTFTASGFVNGDTLTSSTTGIPVLTTSATSKSTAGSYPISISQGTLKSVNYQLLLQNGTLTVSK